MVGHVNMILIADGRAAAVDFELSSEQRALQETAARLLSERATASRARVLAGEPGPTVDWSLWSAMADQGWPAVALDEGWGGLGLGLVELSLLLEEIGRYVAAVPLAGTVLAAGALADAVDRGAVAADAALGPATVGTWVRRLCRGDAVGAVAWGLSTDGPATPAGAAARRRSLVAFAPVADIVVELRLPGPTLTAWATGVEQRPSEEPTVDLTRAMGWFPPAAAEDGVGLGGGTDPAEGASAGWAQLPLGSGAPAWAVADRAAVAVAAELLGGASWAMGTTARYATDRVQFGQPIGSFQAVKHRCADMVVDVEGMKSVVAYGAWTVGHCPAGSADAALAASAAKLWCSEAAGRVMASALQVHGGIGFTWDHDLHLYVKRSLVDQLAMGDARWHRDRLAQVLRARVEAGAPVL